MRFLVNWCKGVNWSHAVVRVVWCRSVKFSAGWCRLVQVGTVWYRLLQVGAVWNSLVKVGTA